MSPKSSSATPQAQASKRPSIARVGLRTEVEIIGTASTLRVDVRKHRVELYSHENRKWQDWEFEPSYEQMYIDEIDHFFDCVAKKTKPMSDLRDGYRVQRVIDACARSSDTGRWVAVG